MPSVFYFGWRPGGGHHLQREGGHDVPWAKREATGIPAPWLPYMDGWLLNNAKVPDRYDGRVFWIPSNSLWLAFLWWDNSGDNRGNSNSGFYVHGFAWPHRQEALKFASERFPEVIARQRHPLTLQESDINGN
jgi:hypothetical protein